jgi:hypothetical protein
MAIRCWKGRAIVMRAAPICTKRKAYRAAEHSARLRRPYASAQLEIRMLKIIGWIVAIIFVIGLLVVFGVIDLIF